MTFPDTTGAHRLGERVQATLARFLGEQARQVTLIGPELDAPLQAVSELVAGGKRLRPAFCYWGFRGAGGPDGDEIIVAATSLELLHASALVHDDVMDASDMRRGQPAAHRRFATLHRTSGWTGSADQFGVGAAILIGDLCLAWCGELLRSCGLPEDRLQAGLRVYDSMRTEVISGQYLDLVAQATGGASVTRAMRVIRFKTAKYSVERPLQLGGALAGAPADLIDSYSAFGIPLGEAFQLRDDVLGVFGDPAETGKPAGDDLREGKRTVLVAKALEHATPAQQAAIRRRLGNRGLDDDGVRALRGVIVDTGALDEIEKLIGKLTGDAQLALDAAPLVDPEARQMLHALSLAATRRTR